MGEHHQFSVNNLDLLELFNKYLRWGIVYTTKQHCFGS